MSKTKEQSENRRHRRVDVTLGAKVILGRDEQYNATTVDMSEGGLLLEKYDGPALKNGRLVGIDLQGIVSDHGSDNADESNQMLLRVVRCEGGYVALRFVEEAITKNPKSKKT